MVNLLVTSYEQDLIFLVWDVAKTCELNSFLVEVIVSIACTTIFFQLHKIVEVCIAIDTATGETHVIIKPVDTANLTCVTFALHVLWTLLSVEVEDIDRAKTLCASKEMASVAKLNLTAQLKLEGSILLDRGREYIHQFDVVANCNDNMETTRMECNRLRLLTGWNRL